MTVEKLGGHIILVWHAVVDKNSVDSGHAEILRFSRPLTKEEESQFRGQCKTMLGSEPISTERFDAELEALCVRFQRDFTVEIARLEPESAGAVVVTARKPKADPGVVRTALLAMSEQPPDIPSGTKRRGSRRYNRH